MVHAHTGKEMYLDLVMTTFPKIPPGQYPVGTVGLKTNKNALEFSKWS